VLRRLVQKCIHELRVDILGEAQTNVVVADAGRQRHFGRRLLVRLRHTFRKHLGEQALGEIQSLLLVHRGRPCWILGLSHQPAQRRRVIGFGQKADEQLWPLGEQTPTLDVPAIFR
jgi:hypothetical protein